MRLVCPSCGATASAEAWTNDTAIRYTFETLVQLPSPVLRRALSYMGLFRQGTKALPWRRALIIVRSLKELIEEETVHWQGGETRPCNAEIWGKAIEATIASGPKGLKNHNYMRKCAWDLAADLAVKVEHDREAARKNRRPDDCTDPDALSNETRQKIERMKKQLGVTS
ncbi:MAG: hypothetical protein CVU71_01050 [Deltaproteobacteria bacterium HGW-Deltaproteobacteria-6]|jgi:hypothetical protein|nr:MAG: hypothetical protein CVU71_01050 [Deltaproteobacteria bacterium HGW-Deltaproteobacteria-6]